MFVPAKRVLVPELMDQPGLGLAEHEYALTSLGRANALSRTAATLMPALRAAAADATRAVGAVPEVPRRPLRILDIACGGGHVAVALARRLAREGIATSIVGYDMSAVALDFASRLAARAGTPQVTFARVDVLAEPWPGEADVVLCSLFLHHLTDEDAVELLRRMKAAARHTVLVSDLCRSELGFATAWVGCRLLSRSRVFHVDGARSVRAAFRPDEALALAERAGLHGATIRRHWPERFVLAWTRAAR